MLSRAGACDPCQPNSTWVRATSAHPDFGKVTMANYRLSVLALGLVFASTSTLAKKPAANEMLVASTPAKGSVQTATVTAVTLTFAEKVELLDVSLTTPEGGEQAVFKASYEKGAPKKTGVSFTFDLIPPATGSGSYSLSYLLKSASFKSLNGFVDFDIKEAIEYQPNAKSDPVSDDVTP